MSSLRTKILTLTTAATLTAGALLAAVPHTNHMQKMAAQLGLTDTQQAQAKAIFQGAHQAAKPVRQQLRQERQAIQAAIQAGKSDQEIQQMASAEGPQLAQLAAIRASASAKFYSTLTPDQQQKLQAMHQARGHNRKARQAPQA
jgi:protein CpxP